MAALSGENKTRITDLNGKIQRFSSTSRQKLTEFEKIYNQQNLGSITKRFRRAWRSRLAALSGDVQCRPHGLGSCPSTSLDLSQLTNISLDLNQLKSTSTWTQAQLPQ